MEFSGKSEKRTCHAHKHTHKEKEKSKHQSEYRKISLFISELHIAITVILHHLIAKILD